jgi:hypothetical protein
MTFTAKCQQLQQGLHLPQLPCDTNRNDTICEMQPKAAKASTVHYCVLLSQVGVPFPVLDWMVLLYFILF